MPRLSQSSVPKYRLHRASGQAVVTLAGRDHYLGAHGTRTSKLEYDRLIAEWLASGRQAISSPETRWTVAEAILRYLRFAKSYYVVEGQPTDEVAAIRSALRFVRQLYSATPATEFSPLSLKAVRDSMVKADLARGTINKHVSRIRRMFKWLASEELVPADVFHSLTVVDGLRRGRCEARESEPVMPVEDDVIDATIPFMPKTIADMVRLQRWTGMRPGEVIRLRPQDIDQTVNPWRYAPPHHKTAHLGRKRVIFIGPQGQQVLLSYLDREPSAYCFSPADSEKKRLAERHAARIIPIHRGNRPGTNLKCRPKRKPGERYGKGAYRRAIHRACDVAFPPGGELAPKPNESNAAWQRRLTDEQREQVRLWQAARRWSPNQMRHTRATEIRSRYGIEAARTVLGHEHADTTEIYAERDQTLAARVASETG